MTRSIDDLQWLLIDKIQSISAIQSTETLISLQNGIQRQLNVKSLPEKPISRVCLALATTKTESHIENLNIYTAPNVYTEEYRDLCRAYYLYF